MTASLSTTCPPLGAASLSLGLDVSPPHSSQKHNCPCLTRMSASWLGLLTALTNPFCVYSLSCLWSLLTQAPGKSMSSRFSWCHLRAAVTGRGRQCHGDCCPDAPSRHPGPPDLVLSSDLQSPSTATPPPFPECPLPRGLTTIAHKHCQQGPPALQQLQKTASILCEPYV